MTSSSLPRAALILAAGRSRRMASSRPKALHKLAGRSMLGWVLAAARAADCRRRIVALGAEDESGAAEARAHDPECEIVRQARPLGTADAALAAREALQGFAGHLLILYGDSPLIGVETLDAMIAAREEADAFACLLGFRPRPDRDAGGDRDRGDRFGRILCDADGDPARIVEAADLPRNGPGNPHGAGGAQGEANGDAGSSVALCNAGAMCLDAARAWSALERIGDDNARKERYLTDLPALARARGWRRRLVETDADQAMGIDDRIALARAEAIMQRRLRDAAMRRGVTMIAPETVFLAFDVEFGRDVEIAPHVIFGPGVVIGDDVRIESFCRLEAVRIGAGARIGPHACLRGGARIGERCRIGNFVEIKAADLGADAKAAHLAYVGDADIDAGVNLGAGVVTCNYDGVAKHRTRIGAGAFIGSNVSLVAPIEIGAGAHLGAGGVFRRDVPAGAVAVARAEQSLSGENAEQLRRRLEDRAERSSDRPASAPSAPSARGDR